MASDDKEVKLAREQQVQHDTRLTSLESELMNLRKNCSLVNNLTESNSKLSDIITNLQSESARISSNLTDLSALVEETNKSQQRLDDWRLLIQDQMSNICNCNSSQIKSHSLKKDINIFSDLNLNNTQNM